MKIELRDVTKRFSKANGAEEILALDTLTFRIEAGEFFVMLGPSGCGKSTLLSIIAGFLQASSGTVYVDGVPVKGPGPDRAVVFQEYALFPWRTVRGNVEIGPVVRGVDRTRVRDLCRYYIELVGLRKFENRYPAELSGGMKQRVGLARALANEPKVLLMDEPFGALDAQTRQLMQQELVRIWDVTKKTIVFVTHSVTEAILLADRVAFMTARPGRVKKILPISLERPRDPTATNFVEYQRIASDLIRDEVMQAWEEESSG